MKIELPPDLVAAIDRYNDTDWSNDPSKLGALNAVASIGERVAAIRAETRAQTRLWCKACGGLCRYPTVGVDPATGEHYFGG